MNNIGISRSQQNFYQSGAFRTDAQIDKKMNGKYEVVNGSHINIPHDITKTYGVPDSFALLKDRFIAVQYKKKKIIQIYELEQLSEQLNRDPDNRSIKSSM